MHPEAAEFVARKMADLEPEFVVEFGSLDVNGNLRDLFGVADYVGVDQREGRNVDHVGTAETFTSRRKPDLVVCCEVLEHSEEPDAIVHAAAKLLKRGGTFLVTAACDPRPPHRNDGRPWDGGEFYRNVDPIDLGEWLDENFSSWDIEVHDDRGDVYGIAVK